MVLQRDSVTPCLGVKKFPAGTGKVSMELDAMRVSVVTMGLSKPQGMSLGYVLMYFLRGSLPWPGVTEEDTKNKYDMICNMKMATSIESLCESHPEEFALYFRYYLSQPFYCSPNYNHLKLSFHYLFVRRGFKYDNVFEKLAIHRWPIDHQNVNQLIHRWPIDQYTPTNCRSFAADTDDPYSR